MKLQLLRFDDEVPVDAKAVSTLEIEDRALFARVVASLESEAAEEAEEPYALWEDEGDKKRSPRGAFLVLASLPDVPLTDKKLLGKLYSHVAAQIADDADAEGEVIAAANTLEGLLLDWNIELWGSYEFSTSWDTSQMLKAFSFQPCFEEGTPLIERLVSFFGLCADIGLKQPILMVNAKSFLAENELDELAEQAFFFGVPLLLLESWHDASTHEWERKTRIDQWFLEN